VKHIVVLDPTPVIWMGIGFGLIGLMIWSAAYNAYRQNRLRGHIDENLAIARRSIKIVERSAELREQQVQLLEDILQRQEEMVRLLRQIAQTRNDAAENIQKRSSPSQAV